MYDFQHICNCTQLQLISSLFPEIIDGWKPFDKQPGEIENVFVVTDEHTPYATKMMSFLRHGYVQKMLPIVMYAKKTERLETLDSILFDMGVEVSTIRYVFSTVNYYLVVDLFYSKSKAYYKYKLYNIQTKEIETGDFEHSDFKKWKNRLYRGLPSYKEYKEQFARFVNNDAIEPYKTHWDKINHSDTRVVQANYDFIILYCKDARVIYKAKYWSKLFIYRDKSFVTLK